MMTNLLGRTARGQTWKQNVKTDNKWIPVSVEGKIVAVTASSSGESVYVWLENDSKVSRCGLESVQLIPAEFATPLR